MIPKIYRYDDANAPVMRREREAVIEILTACLVDGYGDKEAAGWTRPFVNAEGTKAVFRNDPTTGSGMFLQVDATGPDGTRYSRFLGYENMTDVDTGVYPFSESPYDFLAVSPSGSTTTPRPWLLIADERFFYLFSWSYGDVTNFDGQEMAYGICFFGDAISIHDNDPYFCVQNVKSGGYEYFNNAADGYDATRGSSIAVARNFNGDTGYHYPALCSGGGPVYRYYPGRGTYPAYLSKKVFSRHYLNDEIQRSFRGYLPGLWAPCFSKSEADNFEIISVDGHEFYAVHHRQSDSTNCLSLIDVSESWRP